MKLPTEKIFLKSSFREELEDLIQYAEKAFKEWRPIWSPFISPQIREEFTDKFKDLNDIHLHFNGGYPGAERQRICFLRSEKENYLRKLDIPIQGIYIKGNFLFDRAKANDFREAIKDIGLQEDAIGDIWLIRDRGAQAICSKEYADLIDEKIGKLREVNITIHRIDINEMSIPFKRSEKIINTVEASTRIDAIASAGFSLSRSKIINLIKQGCLRLNWMTNNQPSKAVKVGDLIHLERKGSLKILEIGKTKKERWRIKLLRQ